jgi:hypothetical protein
MRIPMESSKKMKTTISDHAKYWFITSSESILVAPYSAGPRKSIGYTVDEPENHGEDPLARVMNQ